MSFTPDVSDAPLLIVMNAGSGRRDRAETRETIRRVLAEGGRRHKLILVENPKQLVDVARRTVQEAKDCGGVVVVAGGDGTINAVANAVLGSGCAFGVLPLGTFNYFARTHGIPEDTEEATRLLLTARPHPVQVGMVNKQLFLVNASLGLYPEILEDREEFKQQFGRSRLVALLSGVVTILKHYRQLRLTLERHGKITQMRTPTVFVGNNRLQMEQTGIPLAEALEDGQLAAVVLRPVGTLAMLGLLVRGALGQLGKAENVISFGVKRLTVRPSKLYRSRRVKVATDGEISWLTAPLEFCVAAEPLYLLKPDPRPDGADQGGS